MASLTHPDNLMKREERKVKHTHECYACMGEIKEKTKAVVTSSRYDGKLYELYYHPKCENTVDLSGGNWIKIIPEMNDAPDVPVACIDDMGNQMTGKLEYEPNAGWSCTNDKGRFLNIRYYSFALSQLPE